MKAYSEVKHLESALATWATPVLGSQGVLSWHGTVAHAHKALSAREAGHFVQHGYKVEVRTDITVRETAKRAPKAAQS